MKELRAKYYCYECDEPLRKRGWRSGTHVGYYFCDRIWCRVLSWRYKKISVTEQTRIELLRGNKPTDQHYMDNTVLIKGSRASRGEDD